MKALTETQAKQLLQPLKGLCVSQTVDIWNYSFCQDNFMRQEIIPQNWNQHKLESFSLGSSPIIGAAANSNDEAAILINQIR